MEPWYHRLEKLVTGTGVLDENQIYVVVDIEADGPTPGLHSMLSLAAVATTAEKEVARFYRKLTPLPEAKPDPGTLDWWHGQAEAWKEVNTGQEPAELVLTDFCTWLEELNAEPIFVSSPIGLDYTFVSWYLFRYARKNPFMNDENAIRTLDLRSYIAGKFDLSFNKSSRTMLPSTLTKGMGEHTHRAIDDAAGYAFLLRKVIKVPPRS